MLEVTFYFFNIFTYHKYAITLLENFPLHKYQVLSSLSGKTVHSNNKSLLYLVIIKTAQVFTIICLQRHQAQYHSRVLKILPTR